MFLMSVVMMAEAPLAASAKSGAEKAAVKAVAAALPDRQPPSVGAGSRRKPSLVRTKLHGERIGFSSGKGMRRVAGADYGRDFGATSLTLSAAQGERDHGPGKARHAGVQLGAAVGREWSGALATTTSLAVASDSPVFGRLQLAQDVQLKLDAGTRVQVGGRYVRFHDGSSMLGGVAGASRQVGSAQLSYRLSRFAPEGERQRSAHLVAVQLGDRRGKGKSELAVGTGNSLHELVWDPAAVSGRYRTVGLKRSQPLTGELSLQLTAGRTWYERPQGKYQGTKLGLAIEYRR